MNHAKHNEPRSDVQQFRDPIIKPTQPLIKQCLQNTYPTYQQMINYLNEHELTFDYHYYYDGKAWLGKGKKMSTGPRGGKKETTLFWLSLFYGYFNITFYIPIYAKEACLKLPLTQATLEVIHDAKVLGKLAVVPITLSIVSDEQRRDVCSLIEFKLSCI